MFAANIKCSKYCLPCRFSQADLRAVVLTAGKRSDFFSGNSYMLAWDSARGLWTERTSNETANLNDFIVTT
jgi:hypothetical protein